MQDVSGETSAANKNRETEARLYIIGALQRLRISFDEWPGFVRAFYADEFQPVEYHALMTPAPFQAPEFDRLNQSPKDWVKVANRAWELHRQKFLQECQDWVREGVDEPIVQVRRARGTGKKGLAPVGGRRRGDNTPIDQRYEWAAKYLLKVPLKEIAGADADASTVGRVARDIVRLADWATE